MSVKNKGKYHSKDSGNMTVSVDDTHYFYKKMPDIIISTDENGNSCVEKVENISIAFINLCTTFGTSITFKHCSFNNLNLSEKTFDTTIHFKNCSFTGNTNFFNTTFSQAVSFEKSKFYGKVNFNNASFNFKADFSKIRVYKTTKGAFYFKNIKASSADILFDETQFDAPIYFNSSCFCKKISFNGTKILDTFDFSNVDFGSYALFNDIDIHFSNIMDVEIYIKALMKAVEGKYLKFGKYLREVEDNLFKASAKRYKIDYKKITKADETDIISRKETSLIIDVPVSTLKTWTNRKKNNLVFVKEGTQVGYTMASIKRYLQENPPKKKLYYDMLQAPAEELAIPYDDIYKATLKTAVGSVLSEMIDKKYTHIPIIEDNIIQGIFSENTLLFYIYKQGNKQIAPYELKMDEIGEFTVIENNTESFVFIKPNTKLSKVRQLFGVAMEEEKRLGAVFITSNGKPNGELKGMLTSWDIAAI